MNTKLKDFLLFERMIAPYIIQAFFWIGSIVSIIAGIWMMITEAFFQGLWVVILVPIFLRVMSETMILFFRMHETLHEIKVNTTKAS